MAGFPIPNLSLSGGPAGGGISGNAPTSIGDNNFGGTGFSIFHLVAIGIVVFGAVVIFKNRK